MKEAVKVSANAQGQVVSVSPNNPEFGYIRVTQVNRTMEKGWLRRTTISALISGTVVELKAMSLTPNQELEGTIQILESTESFNEKNPEKDYKLAGDTGMNCCIEGQPIYRKTFYTEDVEAKDELIPHDNVEEIKAAYAEMKAAQEAEGTEGTEGGEGVEATADATAEPANLG